jgi:ABC-type transport system involved in multi-copper enzyme maturation permease subunit
MKNTLAIARRELLEKRFVFITALAFTLLTLIVPFMPGVHASERRNALVVASLIFSTGFSVGLAAILGANIIGRELSDGRLSFYFAKPVSPASIWFGKLIAATVMVVVSFAVIILPASLAGVGSVVRTWTTFGDALPTMRIVLATAAVFFFLGHVLGTFVRSRSAWIAFDFIAATICGIALWLVGRSLLLGFAVELTKRVSLIFAIFAGVAIIAAGLWQVAQGRTDRKRSHIELSRFMWVAIGCGLLLVAGFTLWVVSVSFSDTKPEYIEQSGSWAIVTGPSKHRSDYRAAFLYNTVDGRSMRLPRFQPWWGSDFSEHAVIFGMPAVGGQELYIARLDAPKLEPVATGIVTRSHNFALSPDGSRAVAIEPGGILTVYDIAKRSALGSARVPAGQYQTAHFAMNDLVRIYAGDDRSTTIFEYDVVKRDFHRTGEAPVGFFHLNRELTRSIQYWKRSKLEIRDARSGALVGTGPTAAYSARFMRDGRIVAIHENRKVLEVLSPDGALIHEINLPGEADWAPSFSNGRAIIMMRKPNLTSVVVDVDRGVVLRTERGVIPMYVTDSPTLLAWDGKRNVIVWNPTTNEKKIVARNI